MKNLVFLFLTLFLITTSTTFAQALEETIVDIDGNVYHTVKIGTQTWTIENLRVTHYQNGNEIQHVKESKKWDTLKTGAYCNYKNKEKNVEKYGRLYNWYAIVDSNHIAPKGWHVPTQDEWETLINFLGGRRLAGGKMKSVDGWISTQGDNRNGDNSSGLNILPAGYRLSSYSGEGEFSSFWSSTETINDDGLHAWFCGPDNMSRTGLTTGNEQKQSGYSIRLIKD